MDILKEALETVGSLDPLSLDASPAKVDKFKSFAGPCLRISQELVFRLSGLIDASGLDPDDGDDAWDDHQTPPTAPPVKIPKNLSLAIKRIDELAPILDLLPIAPSELSSLMFESVTQDKLFEEQKSLAKILRGYTPHARTDDWKITFGTNQGIGVDWLGNSVEIEHETNVQARLLQREATMCLLQETNVLCHLSASIMTSIHTLRFAKEWNGLSDVAGGKKKKTAYRMAAFAARNPDMSVDDKDYELALKKFTGRHEKVVSTRNTLYRFFLKFHVAVLLDPMWTPIATYDIGTTGRTPSFGLTAERFVNFDPKRGDYYGTNLRTFKQIIEVIFTPEIAAYIRDFLDEFPHP